MSLPRRTLPLLLAALAAGPLAACRVTGAGRAPASGPHHVVDHEGAETCELCRLYDARRASVLRVTSGAALGAGVVVSPPGLIVTNAHVVGTARQVTLETYDEETLTAEVVFADPEVDLALLRARGRRTWSAFRLDADALPQPGSEVYAIGHPLGLGWSLTRGIVSAVRTNADGTHVIQTDAAISPGNSGGPLIDDRGHLLGIVTSKAAGGFAENLAFALPTESVLRFLDRALAEPRTTGGGR